MSTLMSKPLFWEKYEKYFKMLSAEILPCMLSVKASIQVVILYQCLHCTNMNPNLLYDFFFSNPQKYMILDFLAFVCELWADLELALLQVSLCHGLLSVVCRPSLIFHILTSPQESYVGLSWNLVGGIVATWKFRIAEIVLFWYPRWPPWWPFWNSSKDISSQTLC